MMEVMKVAVFNTKRFEKPFLEDAARDAGIALTFLEPRLDASTAPLAAGHEAALIFVNDVADRAALENSPPEEPVFWLHAARGLIR